MVGGDQSGGGSEFSALGIVVTQRFTDWPEEPVQSDTQTQCWSKGCVDIRCRLSVNRAGTMGLGSRGVNGPQTHRNTVVTVGARLLVLV